MRSVRKKRWGLGVVVVTVCVGLAGCDPLAYLDAGPRPHVARAPRDAAPLPRVEAVVSMQRADILTIVADGETQAVHLAGVCAPSPVHGRFNTQFAAHTGLSVTALPQHGREAMAAVRGMLATGAWRVVQRGVTTNKHTIWAAVDFVNERDESLVAALLERGYVARVGAAPHTVVPYDELERMARMAETGIWRHSVPLERRVRMTSTFARETVSRDTQHVYEQRSTVTGRMSTERRSVMLERHENIEERGVINLDIAVQPPLTRPYELLARYRFLVTEERGRQQQTISGLGDDGKRTMTPRSPGGTEVRQDGSTQMAEELLLVTNGHTRTQLVSAPVAYTKSVKAGIAYQQGQRVTGYELEVLMGTSVVYYAREAQ